MTTTPSDINHRARSLWKMALRLRRMTESPSWEPPIGRQAISVINQLDFMCDEIERLLWTLQKENHSA